MSTSACGTSEKGGRKGKSKKEKGERQKYSPEQV